MSRRIVSLRQPEGGAEFGMVYELHHRCPESMKLARSSEEDADLVWFGVGDQGQGMPKGVPFSVVSAEPCGACGRYVGVWFCWQAGSSGHSGEIWTP